MIRSHDGKTVSEMILEELEPLFRQGASDGTGVHLCSTQCKNMVILLSQSVPIDEIVDTTARLIRCVLSKGGKNVGHNTD